MRLLLSFLTTFLITLVVPVLVYGLFTAVAGLREPEMKLRFLAGVVIQKLGTTTGFVLLFFAGGDSFRDRWLLYSLVWVAMFVIVEIGQAAGPGYSKCEALAGAVPEAVYFPLSGLVVASLLA